MADRRYNCIARRGRRSRGLQGSRGAHGRAPAAPPAGGAAQSPAAQKPARKRWLRALCIVLAVLLFLGLALFGMQVGVWAGNAAADRAAAAAMERAAAYADTDLSSILSKEHLTVADYELIYRCTGLTRAGVDRCLAQGEEGKDRILQVQRSFCASYGVRHTQFGFFCVNDYLDRGIAVATRLFGKRRHPRHPFCAPFGPDHGARGAGDGRGTGARLAGHRLRLAERHRLRARIHPPPRLYDLVAPHRR